MLSSSLASYVLFGSLPPLASVICYSPSFAAGLVVTCRCRLHFSRESATAGVLGAAKVAQMAEELDRVSSVLRYYYIWAD
jgi:hypothetical protein